MTKETRLEKGVYKGMYWTVLRTIHNRYGNKAIGIPLGTDRTKRLASDVTHSKRKRPHRNSKGPRTLLATFRWHISLAVTFSLLIVYKIMCDNSKGLDGLGVN